MIIIYAELKYLINTYVFYWSISNISNIKKFTKIAKDSADLYSSHIKTHIKQSGEFIQMAEKMLLGKYQVLDVLLYAWWMMQHCYSDTSKVSCLFAKLYIEEVVYNVKPNLFYDTYLRFIRQCIKFL